MQKTSLHINLTYKKLDYLSIKFADRQQTTQFCYIPKIKIKTKTVKLYRHKSIAKTFSSFE